MNTTSNPTSGQPATTGVAAAPARVFSRPRFTLAVMAGAYPLITALLYAIAPFTLEWAVWQKTLVAAPLMVVAMVWGLIPAIHRHLKPWLHV